MSSYIHSIRLLMLFSLLGPCSQLQAARMAGPLQGNCYVFSAAKDSDGVNTGSIEHAKLNVFQASAYPTVDRLAESAHSLPGKLSQTTSTALSPFWQEYASLDFQHLPVPASLLFVGLWLIGFSLTRQPPPSIKRQDKTRFDNTYLVKNLTQNTAHSNDLP